MRFVDHAYQPHLAVRVLSAHVHKLVQVKVANELVIISLRYDAARAREVCALESSSYHNVHRSQYRGVGGVFERGAGVTF